MSISLVLITSVVFYVPSCFAAAQQYEKCLSPLRCGSRSEVFPNITYPFWGTDTDKPNYCGQSPFKLSCEDNQTLTIEIANLTLRVVSVELENKTITVADDSVFEDDCPKILYFNGDDQFTFNPNTEKVELFDCSGYDPQAWLSKINCTASDGNRKTYHVFPQNVSGHACETAGEVPMLRSVKNSLHESNIALGDALKKGFVLRYSIKDKICRDCSISGGICGSESRSGNFRCLCEDKSHNSSSNDSELSKPAKIGIGVACGFLGLRNRKPSHHPRYQNLKAQLQLKQYNYAEVKKITKSFSHIVGKGGFGTVYEGNLCDGRKVAVKILKDFKGNGEDFINEVASMSQTSHVNIVSLLGFCYEGSKRAIVYEFLENGSLDQFISKQKPLDLDVTTLYGIALGVARGLEYLHHGCKTRIVHFDIKPQNILLDDNLCPKVSDFGLAKLCEKRESMLSLLDARGTIGYIAPEVFSRMYGRVSYKSDVYSYGMLVLEMIGARNKETVETAASNSSSAYFPDWIYKDLENGEHIWKFGDEITSEENEIAKKMTLVGLWCIQPCPSNRPPMNRVVEMMEGSLDALDVPPKPSLHMYAAPLAESSWLSEENSSYSEALI